MEEIDPISLAGQAYLLIVNLKGKLDADYINQICDPLLDYTPKKQCIYKTHHTSYQEN